MFDFDDYADTVPINAGNLFVTFDAVQRLMNTMALDWNRDISYPKRFQAFVYTMKSDSDPKAVINNGLYNKFSYARILIGSHL